jgi:recombinational DNA repair ATPase RecF
MGELKIMCLDGFEKLDEKMQKQVIDICEQNDIQAFMTITEFTDNEQFIIENAFEEE